MKFATRWANSPLVHTNAPTSSPLGGMTKRGFDILFASVALLFLSPIFLMLMGLVKYSDGGCIFYGHRRIGHSGRTFKCWKFRTMREGADHILKAYLDSNPAAYEEWRKTRKLLDDPRVTTVGIVLRKLSLDELPQLFNILRGEMSIVGPRPVVEDELEMYEKAAHYYLRTRPGLTGLWQVSGRNDVSYASRVALDCEYVENWSLMKDIKIIGLTIPAVYLMRGSY